MSREVRTRLVTLGVLALIFGLGVLVGVVADRTVEGARARSVADEPKVVTDPESDEQPAEEEGVSSEGRRRLLIHQVDLSDDQRVFVDSVVGFYRAEVRALSESYDTAYRDAVQATRDALRGILDPLQRARYDALLDARDRARGREEGGSGR